MNRKTFTPTDLTLSDQGAIVAAFAQFNVVDHDGDITRPGAFPVKDVPMSAYGHTSWDGALPIGKGSISESGDWAVFSGQFFMDTTHGRDAYNTVKGLGQLAQYSYGYTVLDGGPIVHEGKSVNELRKLDPHEISPVLMGSGIGTHTLAIKSGGPVTDLSLADHSLRVREDNAAYVDRVVARDDMRTKEGRTLSAATRADIAAVLETYDLLGVSAGRLRALLELYDQPKDEEPKDVTLDVLLAIARRNGVPV